MTGRLFVPEPTKPLAGASGAHLLRQRGALEVLCRADGLCHLLPLLQTDRCLVLLAQLRNRGPIRSQVELRADEDHRHVGAVMLELGVPLLLHVLEGRARDEGEGDEEDVGLRVGERSQAIVVLCGEWRVKGGRQRGDPAEPRRHRRGSEYVAIVARAPPRGRAWEAVVCSTGRVNLDAAPALPSSRAQLRSARVQMPSVSPPDPRYPKGPG